MFLSIPTIIFIIGVAISYLNAESSPSAYDADHPYCFRFTWLGPKFYNDSIFMNKTCDDAIGEKGTVPCTLPLVVSENGQPPNTTWMWETYRSNAAHIACRLTQSEVCVRFTYKFNQALENVTYMCSKVQIEDGGVVRSSCYSQFEGGREIEVCACESVAGRMPCNSSPAWQASSLTTVMGIVLVMVWRAKDVPIRYGLARMNNRN